MQSSHRDTINAALRELANSKSISSALFVCNALLGYMGTETRDVEDIELSKFKLPNAERYDRWFDAHPHFRGDRACFDLSIKESILEAKFFALQKRSKLFIAGSVNFTPNFEDRDYTRNDPSMRVGIDFFLTPEKDSLIVVLSNKGALRLVEVSHRLTNTQDEIFSLWHNIAQTDDKNILHTTLWESFKLSSLNKKFYEGIVNSFTSLTQHLRSDGVEEQLANQFANRIHGRLLFLWFLRKKNIINTEKEYFNLDDQDDTAYYATKLSTLFFKVLNNEVHNEIDSITPYLNGGLFDQQSDGIYWNTHSPTFPIGFFKSLYAHFDSFNFTTDESTPEYEQIAIDPEMLGRIFESFLATLTTETGAQAKKANGAFYTPREIVSYMSRESLRQYLYTSLNADEQQKNSIDELLDRTNSEWARAGTNSKRDAVDPQDREKILSALRLVKVLDPAVGSGAFPMGILHKILSIFERLEPNFDSYETKLAILKNNIYGVDIDPTAIEISRLRAWLSIIVDVKDVKKIKPLPNLDFKFVCANSLIGLDNSKQVSLENDPNLKSNLIQIRDDYYATSSKYKKEKLQKEYTQKTHPSQLAMFETIETTQLKSYQPFENGRCASFYDAELMHGVEQFDVVIGNPPYVGEKGNKNIFEPLKKSSLGKRFYKGKMDLFYLFFHLGIDLLKNDGIISFITTNYYPTAAGATKLREDFHNRTTILSLQNFNELKIFESALGQKNIITILRKGRTDDEASCLFTRRTGVASAEKIAQILSGDDSDTLYFKQNQSKLYYGQNLCIKCEANDIELVNFEKDGLVCLGEIFDVSQGVVEAPDKVSKKHTEEFKNYNKGDGIFVINKNELDSLKLNDKEKIVIKKYLNSSDVSRYSITFNNQYLIFSDKVARELIKDCTYPNLKKHLDRFQPLITSSNAPYGLHRDRSSEKNIFEQPKLICKGMFSKPEFSYDNNSYYVGFSFSVIWQKNSDYSLKYLLGLLNSKVGEKWFNQNGKKRGVGVDIGVGVFRNFPVPTKSEQNQHSTLMIERLVDQILTIKNADSDEDTKDIEAKVDDLVYEIYGFSKKEIGIIENISK